MVRDNDPKYNNLSYGFLDTEKLKMVIDEDDKLTSIPVCNFNFAKLPVHIMYPQHKNNTFGYIRFFLRPFETFEEIKSLYQTVYSIHKVKYFSLAKSSILYDNSPKGIINSAKNYKMLINAFTTIDKVEDYEEKYQEELETFYQFYTVERAKILKKYDTKVKKISKLI